MAVNTCFITSSAVLLRCPGCCPACPIRRRRTVPSASGSGQRDAGPDVARIGAQLRAARLAARKSMADVAEEAGLTKGFLSKLERDLTHVSVASLIRICGALNVSVGSLCQASGGEVIGRGPSPPIDFGGTGVREYLLTPSGEKRVQAILSDI